jgi:hypothetical protein
MTNPPGETGHGAGDAVIIPSRGYTQSLASVRPALKFVERIRFEIPARLGVTGQCAAQAELVRMAPGIVMVITPPHMHWQVEPAVNAGCPEIMVVGDPGAHGPTGTGTHGIGVSVPSAAAVADATVGFDKLVHIAKGGMFMPGTMLVTTAAGRLSIITVA